MEDIKRMAIVLISSLLIFSFCFIFFNIQDTVEGSDFELNEIYYLRDSIRINSNADFTGLNGVTFGDGSISNPWIIEDCEINSTMYDAIYIGNTTEYFILQNCIIHSTREEIQTTGVRFDNVSNGTIDNLRISNDTDLGIFLWESSNIIISNSNISCHYGISTSYSSNNKIENNTVFNALFGISSNSENDIINGNVIMDGIEYGSGLETHSNCSVFNNEVYRCGNGIRIMGANNIVKGNTFMMCSYGIDCYLGNSNNLFFGNSMIKCDSSAWDFPNSNNRWDNGYPDGGNYWGGFLVIDEFKGPFQNIVGSDGLGDEKYFIQWDLGAMSFSITDHYPLIKASYDIEPPISTIERQFAIAKDSPFQITCTANDIGGSGIKNITLYYSYNASMGGYIDNWILFETKTSQQWSWNFDFPMDDGIYAFLTIAVDNNNNIEEFESLSQIWITFDTIAPKITLINPPESSIIMPGTSFEVTSMDLYLDEFCYSRTGLTYSLDLKMNYLGENTYGGLIDTSTWADGRYQVNITSEDIAGNLAQKIVNFTIDGTAPIIINVNPQNATKNISTSQPLTIWFNESMSPSSVEEHIAFNPNIQVQEYNWNVNHTILAIVPFSNLSCNTTYTITINEGKDIAGNRLNGSYIWSFKTWNDFDMDGVPDYEDSDNDNDGVPDANDKFPFNPDETSDNDGDGIGDNEDQDDDNDGIPDLEDSDPLSPESKDFGIWGIVLVLIVIAIILVLVAYYIKNKI